MHTGSQSKFVLFGALVAILFSSPALARNHFLLEVTGSVAGEGDVGAENQEGRSLSGTFGFGGRVPGFAPAYYLIGRVGSTELGYTGPKKFGAAEVYKDQADWAIGGRLYLPLSRRVRLMAQLALGEIDEIAVIARTGEQALSLHPRPRFAMFMDGGVQFRLNNNFSLGLVGDIAYHPESDSDTVARTAGLTTDQSRFDGEWGRRRLGLSTTLHF